MKIGLLLLLFFTLSYIFIIILLSPSLEVERIGGLSPPFLSEVGGSRSSSASVGSLMDIFLVKFSFSRFSNRIHTRYSIQYLFYSNSSISLESRGILIEITI